MSSSSTDNQDDNNNEANGLSQTVHPLTPSVTEVQTPILEQQNYQTTFHEETMIDQIDAIIRRLLTSPNHQSPYQFAFRWTATEPYGLNYSVALTIHETTFPN
ncbi:unnamed protein product [Rotaria sp. Silwood2]|nr:unnamed protein product [Rotaria sp. Silwood2]CAF3136838.1 unnamed protein product [Rotaria sp. Silwood2]CAF3425966.1 unnamed protein product [Rotaria sp. Silwood2]CAF4291812.1 unnamed protein product [Rotaria sp. Silwood2]CAF4335150.1 unnamed protein product [Rotaria sp. Silwood2]